MPTLKTCLACHRKMVRVGRKYECRNPKCRVFRENTERLRAERQAANAKDNVHVAILPPLQKR